MAPPSRFNWPIRESVDFDFFSSSAFNPGELYQRLGFLHAGTIVQTSGNTLGCVVPFEAGQARISFFGGLDLDRVEDPLVSADNGIHVASLADIGGMKLAVIQKRAEAKDYIDIAALLDAGQPLELLLAAGRVIYGSRFQPAVALRALAFFDDLAGSPPAPCEQTLRKAVSRCSGSLPAVPSRGKIGGGEH